MVFSEQGMNDRSIYIPVMLEEEIVAIVGLSGDFASVSQYGEIIVKVTEILLTESFRYERKIRKNENCRYFLSQWLSPDCTYDTVRENAKLIGYDIEKFTYLGILSFGSKQGMELLIEGVLDHVEQELAADEFAAVYHGRIILLFTQGDSQGIKKRFKALQEAVTGYQVLPMMMTVSNRIQGISFIRQAYMQAKKLLQLPAIRERKGLHCFEDYSLDLVLFDITPEVSDNYVTSILGNLDKEDIMEMKELLDSYMSNNGSITKTSQSLYMHKNTLQYKLNRIADKTGYNPRELKDLFKLYTAMNLHTVDDEE